MFFAFAVLLAAAPLDLGPTDLGARLTKWKEVNMPLDTSGLSLKEKQVVSSLIAASQQIESIYWRHSDPAGLALLLSTKDRNLKRMLMINGGRFDLIDGNKPFVGNETAPPGRALYPRNLTAEKIREYVEKHPDQKAAIYSPYTVIVPYGADLQAIPYHVIYSPWLKVAADKLREAAGESPDPQFTAFLRLRADALLNDDYYKSEEAWIDLRKPRIDVIFGPNETDLDGVLGVKTSYEAAVLIRDEAESARLELYQKYIGQLQRALPIDKADLPSKEGQATPMEVVNSPFRTGDMLHGYQAVADNLPNDPRIHEAKGTKKVFFKNFMDARVKYVVLPLAGRMMEPEQAAEVSADGYLAAVILHEISHGLGPSFARVGGARADIREAVGPVYGALEEAKADVAGMFCLQWLMTHGALPESRAPEFYTSYVAGIFRSLRYGVAEAHGRAEMMEFNYLFANKGIERRQGKYRVDFDRIPGALASLSKELLTIEATGDRRRAENWFDRYDKMPADLKADIEKTGDVPVDIEPIFSIPVIPR
jgi:hypothetical protein